MALIKKIFTFLSKPSTLAIIGAFLIHITLGTIYTLSNVNSYLTSYMRLNGTPQATYGGSMWLSSTYATGQGLSMIMGGYLEWRFSARVSCLLGCMVHSMSIMCTSIAINYGQLAVILTYGLLPGLGCGLAYMTPMSNAFGWFPDRKGLVVGITLAGFGLGTFVFNVAQTAYVNPNNLSPPSDSGGFFTQQSILDQVPSMFVFLGSTYACLQLIGCLLLFKAPQQVELTIEQRPIARKQSSSFESLPPLISSQAGQSLSPLKAIVEPLATKSAAATTKQLNIGEIIRTRQFVVLFIVYGATNQGVMFVNSMLKEYAQMFIKDDLFLAWSGSAASLASSAGRLGWGLAIDRFTFSQCLTVSTVLFGTLIFLMPFEFVLSSKALYLICSLAIFASFSGWKSTYPVHLARVFGTQNSSKVYGMIYMSQTIGGILTAFGARYLIDNFSRFVPFFVVALLEALGLLVYHLFYRD